MTVRVNNEYAYVLVSNGSMRVNNVYAYVLIGGLPPSSGTSGRRRNIISS